MAKLKWSVKLGPAEWKRFTYSRSPGDPVQLIGSVKRGQQLGALALIDGQYFQINGDHQVALNQSQIASAVANAPLANDEPYRPVAPRHIVASPAAAAPTIVVKRRRVFSVPEVEATL